MASACHLIVTLVIAALVFPSVAFGAVFTVWYGSGWTVGFDYAAWVKDKEFHVGDKLIFKYSVEKDNVFQVNGTAFKDCVIPPPDKALVALNGMSVILFNTPGREWYICGVGTHCKEGQKLPITILPAVEAPSANGTLVSGLVP